MYYSNIQLFNESCLEVMKKMKEESVDLIVTDPPYKVTSRGRGKEGTTTSGGMLTKKIVNSGKVFNHNNIKPQEYIPEMYRLLKDGGHCYIMCNNINLLEMLNTAKENNFHFVKSLIWDKGNKIMSQLYMNQFEYILFFRKGKFKKINNCGTSDIITVPNKKTKDENNQNLHDTEKPIELMKILIENSSQENEIVFDPFLGIGSTGIASIKSKRQFIGCEIDERYFEIAKKRIIECL